MKTLKPSGEIKGCGEQINLYVVEYEHGKEQYRTVVEATDIESAKRQFRRDNPDVEMLACY